MLSRKKTKQYKSTLFDLVSILIKESHPLVKTGDDQAIVQCIRRSEPNAYLLKLQTSRDLFGEQNFKCTEVHLRIDEWYCRDNLND